MTLISLAADDPDNPFRHAAQDFRPAGARRRWLSRWPSRPRPPDLFHFATLKRKTAVTEGGFEKVCRQAGRDVAEGAARSAVDARRAAEAIALELG
jgi:hypothetical protein